MMHFHSGFCDFVKSMTHELAYSTTQENKLQYRSPLTVHKRMEDK